MIKVIRRHQKKFLAGLTIFSMVAFLVNRGSSGQGSSSDREYGTVLGKPIYTSDLAEARAELQALSRSVRLTGEDGQPRSILAFLGPEVSQEIVSKPEWFLMLSREADAANIQADRDEVESIMVNDVPKDVDRDSDLYAAARAGVVDLLKIFIRFQQLESAVKVSKPMLDSMLARYGESLSVNLVQVNGSDFLAKVPPPTTQQVQDQFTAFASFSPHKPVPTTNPFGFGYKLPMRSKIQYLRISTDEVAAAVIATKSTYDWEVAARKYFLNNPQEFTKPATTNPTTAPSGAAQPAIQLTFDQAHDQVLKAIRTPLVKALMDQVQSYLTATLNADYQAYLQFCTSGKGGVEPDSSQGVGYSTFTYVSKLIDTVKSRFNVAIHGSEMPDYLSTEQIGGILGIGTTKLTEFVDKQALAYLDLVSKKDPSAPAILMKPSLPLPGSEDQTNVSSIVFVRLAGVKPSEAPADMTGIRSQVEADVRTAAAFKLAQAQAAALQSAARQGNLAIAAIAAGKTIIPLQGENAISMYSNDIKGVYPPLGDSGPSFSKQAFDMMGTYDPRTNPHPVQTIELPEQDRLFVAQLTDVTASWDAESYYRTALEYAGEATSAQNRKLSEDWFNYDAVVQRVGFKPIK